MNAKKLSKRLETVASFVPTGATLADIGSDHAYLPCYLVHEGIASRAIAGEVVRGPYESAFNQVKEEGLAHKISVRLADGLDAINHDDHVDTITIAGMGGPLIVSILEKGKEKLENVTRLILQPNIHAKVIREWALNNGWAIYSEKIIEEDEKIYEIVVLQRGSVNLTEAELLLGPNLMRQKNDAFRLKWTKEIENWKRVCEAIQKAEKTAENEEKLAELAHLIELVEGVLAQ